MNYKSTFRDPIGTNYRGYKVFTQAPPSGGGITFITALNILQFFNLEKYGPNSAATYHLLAEALRRGHNNRSHHVGDPAYYNVPLNELISIRRAKMLAENINFKAATLSKSIQSFEIEESKDTGGDTGNEEHDEKQDVDDDENGRKVQTTRQNC